MTANRPDSEAGIDGQDSRTEDYCETTDRHITEEEIVEAIRHLNSNSKTLILKDSSVRSIWTYLTASPCYTTNTNKHDNTTNIISTIKQLINAVSQLINAVSQFLQMCRNIKERERERERFELFWGLTFSLP